MKITKEELTVFIDILKKQSQVFFNRANDFPRHSLTDSRNIRYYNIGLNTQSLIKDVESVINVPEAERFYDWFLYVFDSYVKRITKDQEKIKTLDSDWEKYFVNMNMIYNFYDKLNKLENIHEKVEKIEKEIEERDKKFAEDMYLGAIDEQLQKQYISKFAEKIKEIIEKAGKSEIKLYSFAFCDDQSHDLLMKGKTPILYMTKGGVSPIDPFYDTLDPVKDAHYSFTICSSPTVSFKGDYDTLKDLIKLMPTKSEWALEGYDRYIPGWQEIGLTQKGLELALFSMRDFDWKK